MSNLDTKWKKGLAGEKNDTTYIVSPSHLEEAEQHVLEAWKPFQPIPMTVDGNTVDFFAVLGIPVTTQMDTISLAHKIMYFKYHPDRRWKYVDAEEKNPAYEQECEKICHILSDIRAVISDETLLLEYISKHFGGIQLSKSEKYRRSQEEARNQQEAMQATYLTSKAEERAAGMNGLIILEAYYGAIRFTEEEVYDIAAIRVGRILDVKIPIQASIEDHCIEFPEGRSLYERMGFYDICVGEEKRLYVSYRYMGRRHSLNIADGEYGRIPCVSQISKYKESPSSRAKINAAVKKPKPKSLFRLVFRLRNGVFVLSCFSMYYMWKNYLPLLTDVHVSDALIQYKDYFYSFIHLSKDWMIQLWSGIIQLIATIVPRQGAILHL